MSAFRRFLVFSWPDFIHKITKRYSNCQNNMVKKITLGVLITITFLLYAVAWVLWMNTLVEGWIPITICSVLAILSGLIFWKIWTKVTGNDKFWINFICQLVFAEGLFFCAFFGVNRLFADDSNVWKERVVVEKKYMKERHRTQRVGRRTYTTGSKYYEYYYDVKFSDGKIKTMPATLRQYNHIRTGDSLTVNVEKGFLNIPVMIRK